ncbi:hypothetical protein OIU84_028225, partial [Salix udensis]
MVENHAFPSISSGIKVPFVKRNIIREERKSFGFRSRTPGSLGSTTAGR